MPVARRSNPAPFKRALVEGLIVPSTADKLPPEPVQPAQHIDEAIADPPSNVIVVDGVEYVRRPEMGTPKEYVAWRPIFLAGIAEGMSAKDAAAQAGVAQGTPFSLRKRDPEFAAQWAEAADLGTLCLEEEAARRAYQGWEEPVYYKGEKCGTVRRYSDTLLIFLLKGRKPEMYRDPHEYRNGGALGESIKTAAAAVALLNELSNKGSVPQVLEVLSTLNTPPEVPLIEQTRDEENSRGVGGVSREQDTCERASGGDE